MNLQENIQRIKEMMGLLKEEEQTNYSTIIIIGPQGVGKSTLTNALGKKLNMPVISSDEYINQGDWASEPTKKQGWIKRKENEFSGMVNLLNKHLGKPVILDIGGSHGVWEGEQLQTIKSLVKNYPNRILLLPSKDFNKSQHQLRKNLLKREFDMEGAIEYWKSMLNQDENYVNKLNDEDKELYLERYEEVKKGNTEEANYQIDRMQKRLDLVKSGNVNWQEFDYDDDEAEQIQFKPDEFEDYSRYFMDNMKKSGLANHIIYNMGKDTETIMNEIISILQK
jgi:adenylate kinase family enzyme